MKRSWGWRTVVVGHGLLVLLAIFVLMDRLKGYTPHESRHETVPLPTGGPAAKPVRVCVLVLDSLRYETAMDPTIMPYLARLRSEGAYARVANIHNAVTVPSLRTIFTGIEEVRLLAFVGNFVNTTDAGEPSLFAQHAADGGRTIVCARNEFVQFGSYIAETRHRLSPYSEASNEEQILEAVSALGRGEATLVVGHLAYTDHASHRYGIYRHAYREAFGRADQFVAAVRARLPAGAVLVVLGDHGHTPEGKHYLGFHTPTFAVYVGSPFRPGQDLGTIRLASNRYLLSAALGLPLVVDGYMGEMLPQALAGYDPARAAVQAPALPNDRLGPPEMRSAPGRVQLFLYLALLAVLWLAVALPEWSPVHVSGWRWLPVWLAPVGCALPLSWGLGGGAALAALALFPFQRPRWWLLGAVLAGMAFIAWGAVLEAGIKAMPLIEVSTLHLIWFAVVVIGASAATRKNRGWLSWLVFALPALLLVPTNYRYGWNGAAVPALLGWLAFYVVSVVRERRAAGESLAAADAGALAGLGGLILVLVQGGMTGEAAAYAFSHGNSLLPGWNAEHPLVALIAGPVSAFILLCDRPDLRRVRWGALAMAVLLYPLQTRLWPVSSPLWAVLIGAVALVWAVARWRRAVLATVLGRWTGLALWAWWMRPAETNHVAVCCVLAALVLAVRLMRRFPQPERTGMDLAFLLAVGAVAVGHALSRWSIEDLEWRAAYDWFTPEATERYAPVVLVWLLAKGLAPWIVMRQAVMQSRPAGNASPEPMLRAALGIKCATGLLIMVGIGLMPQSTAAYVEAAQQAAMLAILVLYLMVSPP